jgi:glycerophosphoryl diester phosphodiesterase
MTKNIAHRGFSSIYPENTMLSFEKALETGCDGIELDVHLSRDGQLVIIHDETVNRTTNGTGYVKDMTFGELRSLKIEKEQRIPSLEEYFDFIEKTNLFTNIELKNDIFRYDGMEEKVIAAIRKRNLSEKIIFSSFNHFSILKCKTLAPEISCAFLTYSWYIDVGAYTKHHGLPYVHPLYTSLTDEAVKEIHSHDISINTYTVNDPGETRRLATLGIAGIITDDPKMLRAMLESIDK